MMNHKEFHLITLKTALTRCNALGKIVDKHGNELTVEQLKAKLALNLPAEVVTPVDDDVDVNINKVENIGNVNIINNEVHDHEHNHDHKHEDKEHTNEDKEHKDNSPPNQGPTENTNNNEPEPKKTLAGKLFHYFSDNKDGSTEQKTD